MNIQIIWDLEDDTDGNVQHIAEHDVSIEEVEDVLLDPRSQQGISESSGLPITFGYTSAGRYLAVVWELALEDPPAVRPVTAYETPEPRSRNR
jgi:hypothetical protein